LKSSSLFCHIVPSSQLNSRLCDLAGIIPCSDHPLGLLRLSVKKIYQLVCALGLKEHVLQPCKIFMCAKQSDNRRHQIIDHFFTSVSIELDQRSYEKPASRLCHDESFALTSDQGTISLTHRINRSNIFSPYLHVALSGTFLLQP
jgi:hypothetical protein